MNTPGKYIIVIIALGMLAAGGFAYIDKAKAFPPEPASVFPISPQPQEPDAIGETQNAEDSVFTEFASPTYIQIVESCGPSEGGCLNVRSEPSAESLSVKKLSTGAVLQVSGSIEREGHTWYKIEFKEHLFYPERVQGDWYVAGDFVKVLTDVGVEEYIPGQSRRGDKLIVVSLQKQTLYAYEGDNLYLETRISTGKGETETGPGLFYIFKKTPTRYMQGPLPGSTEEYDLPGVPWSMYFNSDGAALHGTYWHNHFGTPASHGCINLPLDVAENLYHWASISTPVIIQ